MLLKDSAPNGRQKCLRTTSVIKFILDFKYFERRLLPNQARLNMKSSYRNFGIVLLL